jgi:serine/threonine-protein kinase
MEGKLGEGGMGAVFKARQLSLNRMVAVKVLPQHLCKNAQYVSRLKREAVVLARLNHPNVIQCYDLIEHSGALFMVMECVEGTSLASHIEKQRFLLEAEALHYLKQAVLGLDFANTQGVIHRDIKPENMLLAKAPVMGTSIKQMAFNVKIADLGLATFTEETSENTRLTQEGTVMGSPHYMSPEQTLGKLDLNFHTDMYALGITLYYMVTGLLPFEATNVGAVLARKLTEAIQDPRKDRPDLSPSVSLLIQRMTAKEVADRYATYTDVLIDIENIENRRPLAAKMLPKTAGNLQLMPETIEALQQMAKAAASKSKEMPLDATMVPGAAVKSDRQGQGLQPQVAKSSMAGVGIVAVVALVLGVTAFVLFAGGKSPAPNPTPPVALPTPPVPLPTPPTPPVALPTPPTLPPVLPTPPEPVKSAWFEAYSLIEEKSTKGWKFDGDASQFGFMPETNALFVSNLSGWSKAEREATVDEFTLTGSFMTPSGCDDGEIQIGIGNDNYIAVGCRLPADKPLSVYAVRRDSKTHAVLETLWQADNVSAGTWQDVIIGISLGQASFKLNGSIKGSAALDPTAVKKKMVRLAVNKGQMQINSLNVAPPPGVKK